jgi:tetratricopeptide (TPR) repeat protein
MMSKPFSAHDQSVAFYPTWTFLDLREVQNQKFAQNRFMQGINYAREKQYDKAESCYKEVLNLMPFHADCLVAYGALCASSTRMSRHDGSITTKVLGIVDDDDDDDRLSKAVAMLQRAIEIDPQCSNAQKYLDQIAVARQRQETSKSQQLTSNVQLLPQKALNDAMTERAILYGDQDETSNTLHNELVGSIGVTDEQSWREQKKRRHKKKKKKKHRQRKRHDSDLSSSYSSSSLSDDCHSNLSYLSHKKKRKKTTHGGPKRKHSKKK